jgi:hypothetical protein
MVPVCCAVTANALVSCFVLRVSIVRVLDTAIEKWPEALLRLF